MNGLPLTFLLAQADAPEPQRPPDPLGLLFPLLLGVAFVYFFILRPQRREQDEKQKLLAALKKNDRVVTTCGMYGTIVNLKDDEITLRVDDQAKVKVRFTKSAIARVLGSESPSAEADEPGKKA